MAVLIKGMEMPKDCPMCPMSHWDAGDNFRGCEIVPGKKHAIRDPEYANSDHRPNWCPLVLVQPHGRLIDADALKTMWDDEIARLLEKGIEYLDYHVDTLFSDFKNDVDKMPTIIPAEEAK